MMTARRIRTCLDHRLTITGVHWNAKGHGIHPCGPDANDRGKTRCAACPNHSSARKFSRVRSVANRKKDRWVRKYHKSWFIEVHSLDSECGIAFFKLHVR